MENVSRHMLAALLCGTAGPATALLVGYVAAPWVFGNTIDDPGSLGDVIGAAFLTAIMLLPLMALVAAVATLAALVATGCPRPALALVTCLVATPGWAAVVDAASRGSLGFVACAATLGVLPAVVRLGFGLLSRARPPAGAPGHVVRGAPGPLRHR